MTYDAEALARNLSDLGRDLQAQVTELSRLEKACVEAEGAFRVREALHEDEMARATLKASGSNMEARKAEARLACLGTRQDMEEAWEKWSLLKAQARVQQASLQALHRRVEIGRSLLSREKALISLGELWTLRSMRS